MNSKETVLIVDDNVQYAQLLDSILTKGLGFTSVMKVHSTKEALELIRSDPKRFSLLFVDYHFPDGTTGGALLQSLANEKLLDAKKAFLITAEPTIENQKEAIDAGAMGVVAKPFSREKISQQLEKAHRRQSVNEDIGF